MAKTRICAVKGCDDRTSPRHRFPHPEKYGKRFQEWVRICNNPVLAKEDPLFIYRSYRVCHIHFRKEDIASNMLLNKTAVPNQHLTASLTCE